MGEAMKSPENLSQILLALLADNPDIQMFIDQATTILGNPVAMVDTRFRVLYASEKLGVHNPLWDTTMAEHYVSEGIINAMAREEVFKRFQEGTGAFELDLPDGFRGIRMPLFYRGEYCGFIGVYNYVRSFCDTDTEALETIAKALTVLYNADPNILGRVKDTRDDLLLELIKSGSPEMAQIIMRRNSSLSFGEEKTLVCLTRRIDGISAENVAFGRLKDFLRYGVFYHVSAIYNNRLLLLFSLEKATCNTKKSILNTLHECCEKYDLHVGLSYEFTEDTFVPLAYKQALKAALYGQAREKTRPRLAYYEDYMLDDMMNATLRVHRASFYAHPVVTKLMHYDEAFGTKYIDTLRCYLNHFCNMKVTALDLGVHYNTIKYRISMMEEISGRELKDNDVLLMQLEYSLRVHDFEQKHKRM